jgi:phosphate uptake regulator
MEYRKIIEFGKSSYVVSLPKAWLNEKNLKKGDVIYMDQQDERLVMYPAENKESKLSKNVTIDITNMTKHEVHLQLVSKYIQNFNEITLKADNMKSRAKDVRTMIRNMMALEVVEQDASKIVTKDFLHMEDITPATLIKKMDIITRKMIVDSKEAFKEDKHSNISERDVDVNTLSYLVFRSIRYLQKNPALLRKKGLNPEELLIMWNAAMSIENIADQTKRIAKLLRRVKFQKQEQEEFHKLYSSIEKYYIDSVQAFYDRDAEKAFKLGTQKKKLIKQCRDFYRQNWHHEWVPVILEKMKAIIADSKSLLVHACNIEQ